jgi:hypothetical protein
MTHAVSFHLCEQGGMRSLVWCESNMAACVSEEDIASQSTAAARFLSGWSVDNAHLVYVRVDTPAQPRA